MHSVWHSGQRSFSQCLTGQRTSHSGLLHLNWHLEQPMRAPARATKKQEFTFRTMLGKTMFCKHNVLHEHDSASSTLEVYRLARRLGCKQDCRISIGTSDDSHPVLGSQVIVLTNGKQTQNNNNNNNKKKALETILCMSFTLETSHFEMSPLNAFAP